LNQRLKLRLLRVVATVAAQGSLLKAADVLGLTQPALTKSLREIEDLVGVRLFDRHARGVQPNEYGVILVDAAQKILNILSEVETGFDRIDNRVGGTVFVGALPTAAAGVIPGVMRQLHLSNLQIMLRVVEGRSNELSAALALGDIDVVVGRLYSSLDEVSQFERIALYDEPMSFIVGNQHPLAAREQVDIADLTRYEISLPVASLRIRADTQAYLNTLGLQLQEGFTTTALTLQRELMLNSNLVSVIPWLMLRGDIDRGTLKLLKLVNTSKPPPRPAGIMFRRDRSLSTAATQFIAVLTEYARVALPQYQP
jgi:LysR family pca operon transcriptional activator